MAKTEIATPSVTHSEKNRAILRSPSFFSAFLLFLIGTLFLSVTIYGAYHRELYDWRSINLHVLISIPLLGAIVFFALVFCSHLIRTGAILTCASTATCLFVAEFVLILLGSRSFLPREFDVRSKADFIRDLRAQELEAEPSIAPSLFLKEPLTSSGIPIFPLSGISAVNTVFCNELGDYLTYRSDEHGFNNPYHSWTNSSLRLALIGDSFTQGWCVTGGGTFAEQIRGHVPSILNLGMNGNGPLLEWASLREYLGDRKPSQLFWFYFEGNDIENLSAEIRDPILSRYLREPGFSQNLLSRQPELDTALKQYADLQYSYGLPGPMDQRQISWMDTVRHAIPLWMHLYSLRTTAGLTDMQRTWILHQYDHRSSPREVEDALHTVLFMAKNFVDSWGGTLTFVYLPAFRHFERSIEHPWKGRVMNAATVAGLPIIDISTVFHESKDPLKLFPFGRDGHYTREGNALVAREVLSVMGNVPFPPHPFPVTPKS